MQKTPKDNGILSPQTSKKYLFLILPLLVVLLFRQILNYNSQKIHQFSSPPLPSKTYKSDDIQTTVFKKRTQSSTDQKTNGWTGHLNHKIRVILFNWMSLVTFQKGLQRETYALATSYMDEYVLLKPQIKRQQLQLGGFACISLASKVEQSRSIIYCSKDQIDTLFSLAQIQNQQGCILKKLGYRLNPDTYIYWLNMLMAQWDYYATKVESIYNGFRYTSTDKKSFFLSRQVYQMGDLFNCTLKSLEHNKQQISVNLFYISTKKNALKLKRDDNPQILSAKILQKDQFLEFYSTFYSTMFKSVFEPDQKLITRLCKLFGLQVHMANPLINYTNPEQVLNIPKVKGIILSTPRDLTLSILITLTLVSSLQLISMNNDCLYSITIILLTLYIHTFILQYSISKFLNNKIYLYFQAQLCTYIWIFIFYIMYSINFIFIKNNKEE